MSISQKGETAQKKHIAIFIGGLLGGGSGRRALTLARAFAERNHRVDLVVASAEGPLLREIPSLVRLVTLDSLGLRLLDRLKSKRRRFQVVAGIVALANYLRMNRPDVLLSAAKHVNLAALWARCIARVSVPLVLRVSNHVSRSAGNTRHKPRLFIWWLIRRLYNWADAIITVSNGIAEDIGVHTSIPRERIVTIYNPVFTPVLREKAEEALEHPWLAPGSPPLVLGVGRLAAQKDFATLVRAFSRVHDQRPARLVILGEGKWRDRIGMLVRDLGVDADVELPGYVDNPLAWMSRASVFVLSSAWEGLPGVLIEALACGCPVVSTDCPSGPAEILDGGAYGQLVPVGNDIVMAEAILSTMDAPPDSERLRDRAAEFSVDHAVDRYLEVLQGVMAK